MTDYVNELHRRRRAIRDKQRAKAIRLTIRIQVWVLGGLVGTILGILITRAIGIDFI